MSHTPAPYWLGLSYVELLEWSATSFRIQREDIERR